MARHRQIFMNMQRSPFHPFVLLLKYSCSLTWFLFWSHFIPHYSFVFCHHSNFQVSLHTRLNKARVLHSSFPSFFPSHRLKLNVVCFIDMFYLKCKSQMLYILWGSMKDAPSVNHFCCNYWTGPVPCLRHSAWSDLMTQLFCRSLTEMKGKVCREEERFMV